MPTRRHRSLVLRSRMFPRALHSIRSPQEAVSMSMPISAGLHLSSPERPHKLQPVTLWYSRSPLLRDINSTSLASALKRAAPQPLQATLDLQSVRMLTIFRVRFQTIQISLLYRIHHWVSQTSPLPPFLSRDGTPVRLVRFDSTIWWRLALLSPSPPPLFSAVSDCSRFFVVVVSFSSCSVSRRPAIP